MFRLKQHHGCSYQELVKKNLMELDLRFDQLVSNVNTNLIAHDQSLELAGVLQEALAEEDGHREGSEGSSFGSDSGADVDPREPTLELNGVDMDTTCRSVSSQFWSVNICLVNISASFIAKTSVRLPRKLCIFIIQENIFWIKVSKKLCNLLLKTEALLVSEQFLLKPTHRLVHSPFSLFICIARNRICRIKVSKEHLI